MSGLDDHWREGWGVSKHIVSNVRLFLRQRWVLAENILPRIDVYSHCPGRSEDGWITLFGKPTSRIPLSLYGSPTTHPRKIHHPLSAPLVGPSVEITN